jgi:cytochrome c biogenesis protein CcmG, thiol:disulfide interchange protein DsbE
MTTWITRIGLPLVLSMVAIGTGCGGSGKSANSPADAKGGGSGHAEVGKPAPDLSIQTLNGKGKVALDQLSGKTVIVDFWATWCGPCKQSFPKLEELQKKMGDQVQIVGISVDDDKKGVLEFAKENGATFAIGWDEGHSIAERWKVGTMPTTFIVDGTGKVRFIHDGYHDGETKLMEKEVAEIADSGGSTTKVASSSDSADSKKKDSADDGGKKKDSDDGKKKDSDDGKTASTTTTSSSSSSSSDDDKKDDAPPPPKKKGGKKGGRAGGKGGPGKKGPKKKV